MKSVIPRLFLAILLTCFAGGCKPVQIPRPPEIIGVVPGGVYGSAVRIDVRHREAHTEYEAVINGAPYGLGETFGVQGVHSLVVTAKRKGSLQDSVTEINFEIDTEPPPLPEVTGAASGQTYASAVKVYVLEEAGVAYTAQLNGRPYRFGDLISEAGAHQLSIRALKTRNGLITDLTLEFALDPERYTREEIEYFIEIALGSEFGGEADRLKKWKGPIRVHMTGEAEETDRSTLIQVLEDLNAMVPHLDIRLEAQAPNLIIHLIPHKAFVRHTSPRTAEENMGLFFYDDDGMGVIRQAKVLVASDLAPAERAHLLREELTQALGLGQDSWRYPDSIFYQGWTMVQRYAPMDVRVIQMLYDPKVPPNWPRAKARQYFALKEEDVLPRVQVFPPDTASEPEAFGQFREAFLERIQNRDLEFLLGIVDPDFFFHPLGDRGQQAFLEYFGLAENPQDSPLWNLLMDALLLGGVFLDSEQTVYETPYLKARFPDRLDPLRYKVAVDREVPIHERPDAASAIIGMLRYDVIRWLPPAPLPGLPDDLVTGERFQWEHIETLGGLRGYVQNRYLRRPHANTVTMNREEAGWRIVSITPA